MCAPFQWVGQRAFLQGGAPGFLNRRRPGNAHRFFEGGAVSLAFSPTRPCRASLFGKRRAKGLQARGPFYLFGEHLPGLHPEAHARLL